MRGGYRNCWPEGMARRRFYRPTDRGAEARVAARLEQWEELRAQRRNEGQAEG